MMDYSQVLDVLFYCNEYISMDPTTKDIMANNAMIILYNRLDILMELYFSLKDEKLSAANDNQDYEEIDKQLIIAETPMRNYYKDKIIISLTESPETDFLIRNFDQLLTKEYPNILDLFILQNKKYYVSKFEIDKLTSSETYIIIKKSYQQLIIIYF